MIFSNFVALQITEHMADEKNFIEVFIDEDLAEGKNDKRVHTRFPPEPNGYLHIGHAKSICLNFGLAEKYGGKCNLRFDDTNPVKEDIEYVESIQEDVKWLGFDWKDRLFYASDYFQKLYEYAVKLIREEKAYIDDQSVEAISGQRGNPTKPGDESPFRNRTAEENLELFEKMRKGDFEEGSHVLRAKIDMASPNMHMRDPVLYRIKHAEHHRTGNEWCIYPMYDFAHGQSDYFEGITHSVCTLEFENHRPLYDWLTDQLAEGEYRPRQIEFARLNLSYTVMSKRKLLQLVEEIANPIYLHKGDVQKNIDERSSLFIDGLAPDIAWKLQLLLDIWHEDDPSLFPKIKLRIYNMRLQFQNKYLSMLHEFFESQFDFDRILSLKTLFSSKEREELYADEITISVFKNHLGI
ncbi:hypothetical protein LCGC14_2702320, partial [marine sediment metagenome]